MERRYSSGEDNVYHLVKWMKSSLKPQIIDHTIISSDTDFGSVSSLLADMHEKIVATGFFAKKNIQIVGNGIYLKTSAKPFTI